MNVGSLFSGIGGIDLGLERTGMRVMWQCEAEPFRRAVLRKHWPDIPCWESVEGLLADADTEGELQQGGALGEVGRRTGNGSSPSRVDLIAGGFPCQPVSVAGKRKGKEDARWLWPAFARVVRVLRPRYVFVENVPGLLARGSGMGDVLGDLARLGYVAEWECVSAAALGAPHLRYRVWIVAHAHEGELRNEPAGEPWCGCPSVFGDDGAPRSLEDAYRRAVEPWGRRGGAPEAGELADAEGESVGAGLRESGSSEEWRGRFGNGGSSDGWWAAEPGVGRVADGVPARLDRLSALGDAVVPQVAEWIGRRILEAAA